MKILMVGNFEWWMCPRFEILYKGLKENSVEVITYMDKHFSYFKLVKKLLKRDFDVVLVNGTFPLILTKLMKVFHRKKVIYDVFISRYNTEVEDNKNVSLGSLKSFVYKFFDIITCVMADILFLDTKKHINYFMALPFLRNIFYKLNKKIELVYVGADNDKWIPKKRMWLWKNKFTVGFWGYIKPLHGLEIILKAAELLEKEKDIQFEIFYGGKLVYDSELNKYVEVHSWETKKNVTFWSGVTTKTDIIDFANSCDICLGIFGTTIKANMVIPHKVYDTIAMKKPIITKDTDAIIELFENNKNCLLVDDTEELVEAILKLKRDKKLRTKIANNGYKLYKQKFTNKKIGKQLLEVISKLNSATSEL